jgi:hypothetical protein
MGFKFYSFLSQLSEVRKLSLKILQLKLKICCAGWLLLFYLFSFLWLASVEFTRLVLLYQSDQHFFLLGFMQESQNAIKY